MFREPSPGAKFRRSNRHVQIPASGRLTPIFDGRSPSSCHAQIPARARPTPIFDGRSPSVNAGYGRHSALTMCSSLLLRWGELRRFETKPAINLSSACSLNRCPVRSQQRSFDRLRAIDGSNRWLARVRVCARASPERTQSTTVVGIECVAANVLFALRTCCFELRLDFAAETAVIAAANRDPRASPRRASDRRADPARTCGSARANACGRSAPHAPPPTSSSCAAS